MAKSKEELKNLLMKVKEESKKAGLKLNIQKMKIMTSGLISLVQSLSHVQFFATPWTVVYLAPPSMGFSRQEYWSGKIIALTIWTFVVKVMSLLFQYIV